jgi:hypothetical protein
MRGRPLPEGAARRPGSGVAGAPSFDWLVGVSRFGRKALCPPFLSLRPRWSFVFCSALHGRWKGCMCARVFKLGVFCVCRARISVEAQVDDDGERAPPPLLAFQPSARPSFSSRPLTHTTHRTLIISIDTTLLLLLEPPRFQAQNTPEPTPCAPLPPLSLFSPPALVHARARARTHSSGTSPARAGMVTATPGVLLKTCVNASSVVPASARRAPPLGRPSPDAHPLLCPPKRPPKNSDIPIVQFLKNLNEKQAPMCVCAAPP